MPAAERVLGLAREVRGHGPRPGRRKRGVSRPHDPRDAELVREPLRDEERDTEPGRLARAQVLSGVIVSSVICRTFDRRPGTCCRGKAHDAGRETERDRAARAEFKHSAARF